MSKYLRSRVGHIATLLFFGALAPHLTAQTTDPVDRNVGGAFFGGGLQLGLASAVGGDASGPAWGAYGEFGYVAKRDTWNRLEFSLFLETGSMTFKDDEADATLSYLPLIGIKGGYGYSLGDNTFGVWRASIGLATTDIESEIGNESISYDGQALVSSLGWDLVLGSGDSSEFVIGAQFRIYNVTPEDANLGGVKIETESFQVNVPSVYGSFRVRI